MRRTLKKVMSLCLVLFLTAVFIINSYATFSDITDHWAEEIIAEWANKEAINGLPDGTFRPDANVTRAEFVTIINNVMKYVHKSEEKFIDVPANEWYADNVAKAVAAGVTLGIGNDRFGAANNITRQEAAVMMYRAFNMKVKNQNASDKFSDAGFIASWAKDAVSALTENKYVLGRPGNKFAPFENISRAEALTIIDNILGDIVNKAGIYSNNISKSLVVNTKDVILKDMTVNGNLYLAEGIDDGNVTLDSVTVKGDIIVNGGGVNSITLENTLVGGTLHVLKYNGKIRVVAQGSTVINNSHILSGAILEENDTTSTGFGNIQVLSIKQGGSLTLNGDFEEVAVDVAGANIKLENGSVDMLYISKDASNTSVEIAETGTLNMMQINAAANIKGKGKIKTIEIKANQVTLETVPETLLIHAGYSANVGGAVVEGDYIPGQEITPTPTPTNAPTPSGGGGTGGGRDDDKPAPTPKIVPSAIYLFVGSTEIEGNIVGNKATFDLSGFENSDRVASLKIVANPQDAELITSSVNGIALRKNIKNISNITVAGLLGTGKGSVSIGALRGAFGDSITITGTLSKSGYSNLSVSLTINLGDEEGTYPSEYLELTIEGNTITAAVKSGKENVKLSDVGLSALMQGLFGAIPNSVSVDKKNWFQVAEQREEIKEAIAALCDEEWANVTLGDLVNKQVFFKKQETGSTVFTVNIIESNSYAYITTSDKEVIAKIKEKKYGTRISEIGVTEVLSDLTNGIISGEDVEVSVDNETWYTVGEQNFEIASAIATLTNKSWNEIELGDLIGKKVYFKVNKGDYIGDYTLTFI